MRCDASELCDGGCESARSCAPVGGPAADPAYALPSASAAVAARAQLTKRRTRCFVEEVQVARVHSNAHVVAEPELHVRREGRDEVRPRADHALLVLVSCRERLVDCVRLALALARVDLEVRHRLAAERLDQLDARLDLRQVGPSLSRMKV